MAGQGEAAGSRALTLPAHPRAVARARGFLAEELTSRGADELHTIAELLTSELVTNALLHTGTAVTVRVAAAPERARVDVEDGSPVLPVAGILDATAACGRGLVLVDRLSHRWGVTPLPAGGKAVWFEVHAGAPGRFEALGPEELVEMWADGSEVHRSPDEQPTRRVRVEGIDTHLLNATKSHLDDLIRDLTLATEVPADEGCHDEELHALGARLHLLAVDLLAFRNEIRRQALEAAHRGAATLTLELELPVSLRPLLLDYRDALDLADELCTGERLLLAPAPAPHVRFRQWKLDRIVAQLDE